MKVPSPKKRHLISQLLATLFSFGLFLYFAFHLLHGDMGYFALHGIEQKLAETQEKHDRLRAERVSLENRVRLLRPKSLDLDLLDERARVVLGFAAPGEKVLLDE